LFDLSTHLSRRDFIKRTKLFLPVWDRCDSWTDRQTDNTGCKLVCLSNTYCCMLFVCHKHCLSHKLSVKHTVFQTHCLTHTVCHKYCLSHIPSVKHTVCDTQCLSQILSVTYTDVTHCCHTHCCHKNCVRHTNCLSHTLFVTHIVCHPQFLSKTLSVTHNVCHCLSHLS